MDDNENCSCLHTILLIISLPPVSFKYGIRHSLIPFKYKKDDFRNAKQDIPSANDQQDRGFLAS